MATGSTDANGVYQYGSSDTNATFHGLLNIANAILSITVEALKSRVTSLESSGQLYFYRWANNAARTGQAGMRLGDAGLQVDTGIEYRYSGSVWVRWTSPWIPYIPILGGMVIGTGGSAQKSADFRYQDGRLVIRFRLFFGTTGNTYPSNPTIYLPGVLELGGACVLRDPSIANELISGSVSVIDNGVSVLKGRIKFNNTATDRVEIISDAATTGAIGTSSPFTWGNNDGISGEFVVDIL